jgi:hypothetical protein
MTTNVNQNTDIMQSGNKVISSLNEAKGILDSAERWTNEDLTSISSFLTIIQGTVNDTKYKLAQITIHSAETELEHFNTLLQDQPIPESLSHHLRHASLPEEIKSHNFFKTALTHEEYEALRCQIDIVIGHVNSAMECLA